MRGQRYWDASVADPSCWTDEGSWKVLLHTCIYRATGKRSKLNVQLLKLNRERTRRQWHTAGEYRHANSSGPRLDCRSCCISNIWLRSCEMKKRRQVPFVYSLIALPLCACAAGIWNSSSKMQRLLCRKGRRLLWCYKQRERGSLRIGSQAWVLQAALEKTTPLPLPVRTNQLPPYRYAYECYLVRTFVLRLH
jgi:hypothetical protein